MPIKRQTEFGRRLRVAMLYRGVTGQEIADACGLTKQAVSQWTTGICLPKSSYLVTISRLVGASLEWLMNDEPLDMQSPPKARQEYLAMLDARSGPTQVAAES